MCQRCFYSSINRTATTNILFLKPNWLSAVPHTSYIKQAVFKQFGKSTTDSYAPEAIADVRSRPYILYLLATSGRSDNQHPTARQHDINLT